MKRGYKDRKITRREWKEHRWLHIDMNKTWVLDLGQERRPAGLAPRDVDCLCDTQVGRFRKRDAYDCGRPRCMLCHVDKFPKRTLTRQEIKAEWRFQEQLQEIFDGDV